MGLSIGTSSLGARGLDIEAMSLNVGTSFLGSGGLRTSALAALTPTQALVQSFQGTGLLDALLVFDPAHYTTPGSTPGVLVDALGGPITYTAPNTQATPTAVQDASGYTYASADGVDDTLIASANQTVAWICAVLRAPAAGWSNYGGVLDNTNGDPLALLMGGTTDFYTASSAPRGVRRDGVTLTAPYSLAPITDWMVVSVSTSQPTASLLDQLFAWNTNHVALQLAALAIRYTDPTSAQQSQIESLLTPMQQALLASA